MSHAPSIWINVYVTPVGSTVLGAPCLNRDSAGFDAQIMSLRRGWRAVYRLHVRRKEWPAAFPFPTRNILAVL